jgi:hypothetical protein
MRYVSAIVVALTVGVVCASAGVRVTRVNVEAPFDPRKSAALFVGVREFHHDATLAEVPYAVDDAIDLAYLLSIESKPLLVMPEHVVLALSGEPQKAQSREKLKALLAAGATRSRAEQSDIFVALQNQAQAAEPGGVFIVSFATHGISREGAQYLLSASSILRWVRETMIPESAIRDIASDTPADRSLILLDACREKLTAKARAGEPDPRSAAALIRAMRSIHGQVVLSAAAAGEYAYDDERRMNGVFTGAVIDGLSCGTARNAAGIITAEALSDYVNDVVLKWIQKRRDPNARRATQFAAEGGAKRMPLAVCNRR